MRDLPCERTNERTRAPVINDVYVRATKSARRSRQSDRSLRGSGQFLACNRLAARPPRTISLQPESRNLLTNRNKDETGTCGVVSETNACYYFVLFLARSLAMRQAGKEKSQLLPPACPPLLPANRFLRHLHLWLLQQASLSLSSVIDIMVAVPGGRSVAYVPLPSSSKE